MEEIYLELFSSTEKEYHVPIETLVVLFAIRYCDSTIKIIFVRTNKPKVCDYPINHNEFIHKIIDNNELPKNVDSCQLPNLKLNSKSLVAGLCACLRQIIKLKVSTAPDHPSKELLGFKESCLLAPSESSCWTKFCEVDLIKMLTTINNETTLLPEAIATFEMHMGQPVRLHNVHKYTMSKKFSNHVTQDRSILPEHLYAEGSFMTLADVMIFLCIHIYLKKLSSPSVLDVLPLIAKWYERMMSNEMIVKSLDFIKLECQQSSAINYTLPVVSNQSLYKSDAKRYKPRNKIYTRQEEVDKSLGIISNIGLSMEMDKEPFAPEMEVNWLEIPFEANPDGGSLPSKRSKRKYEQLENLAKPVLKLAKAGDVIVDFCSGSGHLGILIAYLRPDCTIVLLENKEESMKRSKLRVKKLNLDNVMFYQCNLDYFEGQFDIGTSLHACGVATDLVIQHCLKKNAVFVCCPCCYGSVKNCHNINYPRSIVFKDNIELRDYLVIGHAADQTHDDKNLKTKQGYKCMNIIDYDRKLQANEYGYNVSLSKLVPESCTPKNHLLVGIPNDKFINDTVVNCFNKFCNIQQ